MPTNPLNEIGKRIAVFQSEVEGKFESWCEGQSPKGFRETELDIARRSRRLADEITEVVLRAIVADGQFQARASIAARQGGHMRSGGRRHPEVTLLGGTTVRLEGIEYLKVNRRRKSRGRPRKKRGPSGSGIYPVLIALGVAFGLTPALGGEICHQIAESDSVRSGRASLARRDIDLGHKQTLDIVNAFSHRAVAQRNTWLEQAHQAACNPVGPLVGKRVVVGTDGGRLRERRYRGRGRRRNSGHRGFDAVWREPRQLVIYVIDEQGKTVAEFRPVYDATMGECDTVFSMLIGYLKALGAHLAEQIIFVADGAKWIWERTGKLVNAIGIDPNRVFEVVDFYLESAKFSSAQAVDSTPIFAVRSKRHST